MDLGEKLEVLRRTIYQFAKNELNSIEAPLSLQSIVMDCVAADFKTEAYQTAVFGKFELAKEKAVHEAHSGTPQDLIDRVNGKGEAKK